MQKKLKSHIQNWSKEVIKKTRKIKKINIIEMTS